MMSDGTSVKSSVRWPLRAKLCTRSIKLIQDALKWSKVGFGDTIGFVSMWTSFFMGLGHEHSAQKRVRKSIFCMNFLKLVQSLAQNDHLLSLDVWSC